MKSNSKFGVLENRERQTRNVLIFLMVASAIGAMLVSLIPVSAPERLFDLVTKAVVYVACGIVFTICAFRLIPSKAYRSGYRSSNGVVWDVTNNKIASGQFDLKLRRGKGAKRTLEELSLKSESGFTANSVEPPELEIRIGINRGNSYAIASVRFNGLVAVAPLEKYARRKEIQIVTNDEVVSVERPRNLYCEWFCKRLREIGKAASGFSARKIPVSLVVEPNYAEQAIGYDQKAKTEGLSVSTQVGYAAARLVGAPGAVGAVIGTSLDNTNTSQPRDSKPPSNKVPDDEIRALVSGAWDKPDADNLTKVAQEFGWTLNVLAAP